MQIIKLSKTIQIISMNDDCIHYKLFSERCPGNNFLLEIYHYGLWVFLHIGMQRTKENIPFHSYVVL